MSDRQNPYARAYRGHEARISAATNDVVPYDELTLNKRAVSSASHFDLSCLPDLFASDKMTQNKRLYSRRSLYNIHAMPDPFADHEQTQNKRAFSSRSQMDLRALPDFVYAAPQTPRSSLSNTSLASNYSQYSLRSSDSGLDQRRHVFFAPPSETLNKKARTSESAYEIAALPDPFTRVASTRRGPATPSRSLSSAGSSYGGSVYSMIDYEPTPLEQFMNPAECAVDLDDATQNKRALTRESVMDVRGLPEQFAVDQAARPLPPTLLLDPTTPTKALNKYALSAASQHDLHNLPCPFENANPYLRIRPFTRRMRDFSAQSMEDLRACPSFEDVATARSFTQTQVDRLGHY